MGLLKTILLIVLFYYAFKFIARIFFPYLLKIFVNKAQQNMQDKFSQQQSGQQQEEGEGENGGAQGEEEEDEFSDWDEESDDELNASVNSVTAPLREDEEVGKCSAEIEKALQYFCQ